MDLATRMPHAEARLVSNNHQVVTFGVHKKENPANKPLVPRIVVL